MTDFATFLFSIYQNYNFQRQSLDQANQHHLDGIQQAEDHHRIGVSLDRELDYREKRRDIWGQVVEENNTLLIIQTVMFSAGFAIIVEGMPPEDSPEIFIVAFSISLAFSMCSLFLGINLGMIVHNRMAMYRITDSHQYYKTSRGIWQHKEVKAYWKKHCERHSFFAKRCFWMGTVSLLICSSVLLWCRFLYLYNSLSSSICFVLIVLFTLITFYFLRHEFDHEILASQDDIQKIYKLFQTHRRPDFHLPDLSAEDSFAFPSGHDRSDFDVEDFHSHIMPLARGDDDSTSDLSASWNQENMLSDTDSDIEKKEESDALFSGGFSHQPQETPQGDSENRFIHNLV